MKIVLALTFAALVATSAIADTVAASYEKLTATNGSAVNLASITIDPDTKRSVDYCFGILEGAPARFRSDGTAATTTNGILVQPGSSIGIRGLTNIKKFSLIATTATNAVLPMQCYR